MPNSQPALQLEEPRYTHAFCVERRLFGDRGLEKEDETDMDAQTFYELIGYVASVLVAISLTMRSILRLRLINLLGALLFTIYGVVLGIWPVAAVNAFIVGIDLYYLWQLLRQKDAFDILEVNPQGAYIRRFLDFYADEIARFQPEFRYDPKTPNMIAFFVLRNMVPAGLFIARKDGETAEVLLDFAIPGYRDFKIGRYLYDARADLLCAYGIRRLRTRAHVPEHIAYLKRMGYRQTETGVFERTIAC
ncbi:MAG: hypothetical protein D6802_07730 [Ardenticatenia bacterium]|nr:MAG: hypothetical protein D6802_07730 [Ardenticatenia bacterium]